MVAIFVFPVKDFSRQNVITEICTDNRNLHCLGLIALLSAMYIIGISNSMNSSEIWGKNTHECFWNCKKTHDCVWFCLIIFESYDNLRYYILIICREMFKHAIVILLDWFLVITNFWTVITDFPMYCLGLTALDSANHSRETFVFVWIIKFFI